MSPWVLGLLLLLVGIGAISQLGRRSAVGDEFGTLWLAAHEAPADIIDQALSRDVHPPTHYLLQHAWGRFAGASDAASRSLSLALLVVLLIVIYRIFFRRLAVTPDVRLAAFLLVATAPPLWMMGMTARYYILAMLIGVLSMHRHERWLQTGRGLDGALHAALLLGAFATHFLLPLILLVSQVSRFWILRRLGRVVVRPVQWFVVHGMALFLAAPLVFWCVAGRWSEQRVLMGGISEGMGGLRAVPVYLAGQCITLLNGAIPFPWEVWWVLPVAAAALYLFVSDWRGSWTEWVSLLALPLLVLAGCIAVLLPSAGYFLGLFRAGHLVVAGWILLSCAWARMPQGHLRVLLFLLLLGLNLVSVTRWFFNGPSPMQTQPVREIAERIRAAGGPCRVLHPFVHGWGDPLQRYYPQADVRVPDGSFDADGFVADAPETVWLIRQNRFPEPYDAAATALLAAGYQMFEQAEVQPQRPLDRWCKEQLKRIPVLGYRPEPSHPFILTATGYRRTR